MHHHPMAVSTHTLELDQLGELNAALARPTAAAVDAAALGLAGARPRHAASGQTLPGAARLIRLDWDGPPEYPYIHGYFSAEGDTMVNDLHTAALQRLSAHFRLRHKWGF